MAVVGSAGVAADGSVLPAVAGEFAVAEPAVAVVTGAAMLAAVIAGCIESCCETCCGAAAIGAICNCHKANSPAVVSDAVVSVLLPGVVSVAVFVLSCAVRGVSPDDTADASLPAANAAEVQIAETAGAAAPKLLSGVAVV